MRRMLSILAIVLTGTVLAGSALALDSPASRPCKQGMHARHMFKSLNLTDDQKTQVKAIMQQARTDAQNATDLQAKRQIRRAAFQKVKDTVLTDAQRAQLEQMRTHRWQHKASPQPTS